MEVERESNVIISNSRIHFYDRSGACFISRGGMGVASWDCDNFLCDVLRPSIPNYGLDPPAADRPGLISGRFPPVTPPLPFRLIWAEVETDPYPVPFVIRATMVHMTEPFSTFLLITGILFSVISIPLLLIIVSRRIAWTYVVKAPRRSGLGFG